MNIPNWPRNVAAPIYQENRKNKPYQVVGQKSQYLLNTLSIQSSRHWSTAITQ